MGLDSPIVGDSLYGSGYEGEQMMLHASFLQFIQGAGETKDSPAPNCPFPF